MARLSVEHYKSNPNTPRPERKTNRLRNLLKHRPSSSTSSSPALLTKTQSPSSPVMPPTVQPGFELIGVLPSERSSTETEHRKLDRMGPTLSEMLREDLKDCGSKDTATPITVPAGHETPAKFHTDCPGLKQIETGALGSPSLGTAFHNAMEIGSSPPAPLSRSSAKNGSEAGVTPFKRFSQAAGLLRDISVPTLDTNDSFMTCDDHDSHLKSSASNIFDDNDSLSQGIREYVASKIAEAIKDHDVKLSNAQQDIVAMQMQLNVKINYSTLALNTLIQLLNRDSPPIDLWTSPKSIGPFSINHARTATLLQSATLAFLALAMLLAVLSGPKELSLVLWQSAVILGSYAAALKYFGCAGHVERDLLLAPVLYCAEEFRAWGRMVLAEMVVEGGEMNDGVAMASMASAAGHSE